MKKNKKDYYFKLNTEHFEVTDFNDYALNDILSKFQYEVKELNRQRALNYFESKKRDKTINFLDYF